MTNPHTRIRDAIKAALQSGPKTTPELVRASGYDGQMMGNHLKMLLRQGEISREAITKGRWRYYIGLTAPDYAGYIPEKRQAPEPRKPAFPIKQINVARSYFGEAPPIIISLPAAPWEVAV
jgi:hypothetical protein